jgi:hypothetical protein
LPTTFGAAVAQHTGPKLSTYKIGTNATTAAVCFAHFSRRLTIRTVSQTQIAAYATPTIGNTGLIPGILTRVAWGREGE